MERQLTIKDTDNLTEQIPPTVPLPPIIICERTRQLINAILDGDIRLVTYKGRRIYTSPHIFQETKG